MNLFSKHFVVKRIHVLELFLPKVLYAAFGRVCEPFFKTFRSKNINKSVWYFLVMFSGMVLTDYFLLCEPFKGTVGRKGPGEAQGPRPWSLSSNRLFFIVWTFFAKKDKLFLPKVLYAAFGRWRRPFLKQGVLNRKGRPKAAHDISFRNRQIHYDAYYTFLIHSIIPFTVYSRLQYYPVHNIIPFTV